MFELHSGMNVCMTGGCVDSDGKKIVRDRIEKFLKSQGCHMQKGVTYDTDILLVSRIDTRKADSARRNGTPVATYQDLLDWMEFNDLEMPE